MVPLDVEGILKRVFSHLSAKQRQLTRSAQSMRKTYRRPAEPGGSGLQRNAETNWKRPVGVKAFIGGAKINLAL